MRFDYFAFTMNKILKLLVFCLALPIICAVYFKEYSAILPFIYTTLIVFGIKCLFKYIGRNVENLNDIKKIDGFGIVVLTWMTVSAIAGIPYLFFGFSPIDALFEGTAGFTTTGGSIFTNFDYPHALFFWRSFTQWLGGLGILVLFIAVLPQFAVAGRQMFFTDTPGARDEKLSPRIKTTASAMYKIYLALTILEVLLLKFTGMPWFEGICTSLSTIACGGFIIKEGIIANSSNATIWIILAFMFISGTSFILLSKIFAKHNPLIIFKNEEFKAYITTFFILSIVVAATAFFSLDITSSTLFRDSAFTVISIMTSTGFSCSDCYFWGLPIQIILLIAMFTGASASSASGGIKLIRWVYIYKLLKTEITRIFHPNAVINVKSNNIIVPKEALGQVLIFMFFYFIILGFTALIVCTIENDLTKGFMGVINAIGNIGFAPTNGFASFHPVSKLILTLDMIIGRVEIIPFLVFLQPEFWKK